ncbi:hypothetical protein [Croceimicrobium sp.]|uniref:hypothetical protein n=1 Tax=Croceimicrobium sp. TaxID=2828340 RepID=UPI003BABD3E4
MRKKPEKVKITQEIIAELKAERTRTGMSAAALLRGGKNVPEKLNSTMINAWMSGKTGSAQSAILDYVVKTWKALPNRDEVYIEMTDDVRESLNTAFKKTGLSLKRLFDTRTDHPKDFNWRNFHSILARYPKLNMDHYKYIIDVLEANEEQGYEVISDQLCMTIRSEIRRTGVTIPHILRRAGRNEPPLVTQTTVYNWLNGKVKRADRKEVKYLLDLYKNIPDK